MVSGLRIDLQKSTIMLSCNVASNLREELAAILRVSAVPKQTKYLGLPSSVWLKLNNWTTKKLPQARRAVLIKTVVRTISTYVIRCFRILDSFLVELKSMTARFFWHGSLETRTHWVSWSKICRPLTAGDVVRGRYCGRNTFLGPTSSLPNRAMPPFTWRLLSGARDLLAGARMSPQSDWSLRPKMRKLSSKFPWGRPLHSRLSVRRLRQSDLRPLSATATQHQATCALLDDSLQALPSFASRVSDSMLMLEQVNLRFSMRKMEI
ncbi:hypothetical protein Salat_0229300 [Sesamum alatum]|uniref:Uncharacterized protein n=1 Tax=Sesamum alatum TaxID=300844 RepID=A0AAE2CY65_9LAMI|nr:hypothetical protein Salat_0229300 [Sesamum alatum]